MKIVVVGGTGLIGSKLVDLLQADDLGEGDIELITASPSKGVDTISGKGLPEAMAGAQVVVDVSSAPSLEPEVALAFFAASGRNLLAAAEVAGVRHHVALSAVGTDRLPASGYFRAKSAQENLIRASNLSYTILRSTPFYEYISSIIETSAEDGTLRISPAKAQPVAGDDVALALRDIVLGRAGPRDRDRRARTVPTR